MNHDLRVQKAALLKKKFEEAKGMLPGGLFPSGSGDLLGGGMGSTHSLGGHHHHFLHGESAHAAAVGGIAVSAPANKSA